MESQDLEDITREKRKLEDNDSNENENEKKMKASDDIFGSDDDVEDINSQRKPESDDDGEQTDNVNETEVANSQEKQLIDENIDIIMKETDKGNDEDDDLNDSDDDDKGFIVDENGENVDIDEYAEEHSRRNNMSYQGYYDSYDLPSNEQMQDARDIFGDAFDFGDLDDEEFNELDQVSEPANVLSEEDILNTLRSKFERSQIIASFCTQNDDKIREMDRPERFQDVLIGRSPPDDNEREQEARWIAQKLVVRIRDELDKRKAFQNNQITVVDLADSISVILKFFQIDNFEVPFIYAYRRDYFHPILEREHLWFIYGMDEKWESLVSSKLKVMDILNSLQDASESSSEEFLNKKAFYRNKMESLNNEIHDLINDIEDAKENVKNARVITESNQDDLESIRESDELYLRNATMHLDTLNQDLRLKKMELSKIQEDVDVISAKLGQTSKYTANAAREILRLFPKERYIPLLENAYEENEVKDIFLFLELLIRGGQSIDKIENLENLEKGNIAPTVHTHDKYSKLLSMLPSLRKFMEVISVKTCEFGDAVRHGFAIQLPLTSTNPTELAKEYLTDYETILSSSVILSNESQIISAVETLIAKEISFEPTIRREARRIYRERTCISTRPTIKGLSEITPFSELFGIHYLERFPISELMVGKNRLIYIRLVEANKNGLIDITFYGPGSSIEQPKFSPDIFIHTMDLKKQFYATSDVSWDALRENILHTMISKYLVPSMESELKRELLRIGREAIIEEASVKFHQLLTLGPYRPIHPDETVEDDIKRLLQACPNKSYSGSVMTIFLSIGTRDPMFLTFIDKAGVLRGHDLLPNQISNQKRAKIKQFILEYKPNTIVINSSGGNASRSTLLLIEKELLREVQQSLIEQRNNRRGHNRNMYDGSDEEEEEDYRANVCIVHDEVAQIFKLSPRAKKMFPELQPGAAAAICLGRFVQEPLAEYCSMFCSADATAVFGYELLFLNLHSQKNLIRGIRLPLLRELERRLVDAVNDVGVDLNMAISYDHLSSLLPFVCGLGLRKADALKNQITQTFKFISNRKDVLVNKLMTNNVYTNAIGFIRIRPDNAYKRDSENRDDDDEDDDDLFGRDEMSLRTNKKYFNPLDDTRIHPECYITHDFAPKICADAMEKEFHHSNYYGVVKELMSSSHQALLRQIEKSPAWVKLWCNYKYPKTGIIDPEKGEVYAEDVLTKTNEKLTRYNPIELKDAMRGLELADYAEGLEKSGKGKRKLQLEAIKDELRYPWLDLRKFIPKTLDVNEMFTIITGESDYSLHIGLKLGATIIEIVDKSFYDESKQDYKRQQKLSVMTDIGIRGSISLYEIQDDYRVTQDRNYNLRDHFKVGMKLNAVVIKVNKERIMLDLSLKSSLFSRLESWWISNRREDKLSEEWFRQSSLLSSIENNQEYDILLNFYSPYFNEKDALQVYDLIESGRNPLEILGVGEDNVSHNVEVPQKSIKYADSRKVLLKQSKMRKVYHPLFENVDYKEAEEKLTSENKGQGEVIFRPSSKGLNHLAITWAFQPNVYLHVDIKEENKQQNNLAAVGSTLYILEDDMKEPFADLDEIYSRYIEPMNDYVTMIMKHQHFKVGTVEDVEAYLLQKVQKEPNRIPYAFRLEPGKPGRFAFTYRTLKSNSAHPVRTEAIVVRPNGYRFMKNMFVHPQQLINYFKESILKLSQASTNGSTNPTRQRQSRFDPRPAAVVQQAQYSASLQQQNMYSSQFSSAPTRPMIPPPPVQYIPPPPVPVAYSQYSNQQASNQYISTRPNDTGRY